jgi:hypothetical protein
MKEQQHTDDDGGGSTDKSQDEQDLRSGSGVCERQPARNHQYGPHQSVMQVHRHRVAPYPVRKPCVADRQRARKRSDATLGLVARQGATGVQSNRKGYRFVRTRDGRVHLPVFFTLRPVRHRDKDAWWFCRRESGRRILMPHGTGGPRYGGSVSATRIAAMIASQVSGSVPRHAARARCCSPELMRGPRGSPCMAPSPFQSRTQNETNNIRRTPSTRHRSIARYAADTNNKG